MSSYRKLYRSPGDKVIAGVAGGLAEYLGTTPMLVRLVFIVLLLAGGGGGLFYLLFWAMMPKQPQFFQDGDASPSLLRRLMKVALCLMLVFLLGTIFQDELWVMPFLLGLIIGLCYLWSSSELSSRLFGGGRLHRSVSDKKLFGVFGGLAETMNIDATILRIIGVVLLFAGVGSIIPLYLLYALLIPKATHDDTLSEPIVIA